MVNLGQIPRVRASGLDVQGCSVALCAELKSLRHELGGNCVAFDGDSGSEFCDTGPFGVA